MGEGITMRCILIILCFVFSSTAFSQDIRSVKITEVENIISSSTIPLIINMWATWCKPCVEEIPYFLEEVKKRNEKGDSLQLILVSLDFKEAYPEKIKSFAGKRKFLAPILWLNETNADYFCPKIDLKWSGAIPATLFVNNQKGYRKFVEEEIKKEDLRKEIEKLLDK
jgi:thiol-disulfide isomerase/thioredoxin